MNREKVRIIQRPYYTVELDDDDIVHLSFNEGSKHIGIAESKQIVVDRVSLNTPEQKQLILVDLFGAKNKYNKEAREFAKSKEMNETTSAMAFIIDNFWGKIVGNFFVGLSKGNYHVRLFTEKQEAIKWLLTFRD